MGRGRGLMWEWVQTRTDVGIGANRFRRKTDCDELILEQKWVGTDQVGSHKEAGVWNKNRTFILHNFSEIN